MGFSGSGQVLAELWLGLIGDYVWVCDLWGMWVGLVVEEEGVQVLVVAARMVGCGG